MLLRRCIIIFTIIFFVEAQVTKIIKRNALLTRRKRYLAFPMNSNFVMTMSYVKAVMQVQPRGINILGECDVPFALPYDARLFKHRRRNHFLQRREIFNDLEMAFSKSGFNGTACLKRMICEAEQYIDMSNKSLVSDLLSAIFISPELGLDESYKDVCHESSFTECTMSFLGHILGSTFTK